MLHGAGDTVCVLQGSKHHHCLGQIESVDGEGRYQVRYAPDINGRVFHESGVEANRLRPADCGDTALEDRFQFEVVFSAKTKGGRTRPLSYAEGVADSGSGAESGSGADSESDGEWSQLACGKCTRADCADSMLICDRCEHGFHMFCLEPRLTAVPKGNWFCAACVKVKQEPKKLFSPTKRSLPEDWADEAKEDAGAQVKESRSGGTKRRRKENMCKSANALTGIIVGSPRSATGKAGTSAKSEAVSRPWLASVR